MNPAPLPPQPRTVAAKERKEHKDENSQPAGRWIVALLRYLCHTGPVKVREAVRRLEQDGWFWVRTRGSHHQYKHASKPGLVTVPGRPGDDLAPGTLNSILKQAGLK